LQVRAPTTATVLQVNTRVGQFATAGPGPGSQDPLIVMGQTNPLHVRIDIDENEIERVEAGAAATVSPRGNAGRRVQATFVRAEPLVRPKRSLTNSAQERVDVRVLQLVYALPADAGSFFVGQQVDAYIPARRAPAAAPAAAPGAQK
jgi:multidrug resistance efflux pump